MTHWINRKIFLLFLSTLSNESPLLRELPEERFLSILSPEIVSVEERRNAAAKIKLWRMADDKYKLEPVSIIRREEIQ